MLLFIGRRKIQETTAWTDPQSADNVDDGVAAWSDPTNIFSSDNNDATVAPSGFFTDLLRAYNFDFSEVPGSATILGVEVRYERSANGGATATLQLLDSSGSLTGNDKSDSTPPGSDTYSSYGGASDLWGATISASDVRDSDFGVGIRADGQIGDGFFVDHVQMRITYEY